MFQSQVPSSSMSHRFTGGSLVVGVACGQTAATAVGGLDQKIAVGPASGGQAGWLSDDADADAAAVLLLRSAVGADPDSCSAGNGSVVDVQVSVQGGGLAGIEFHSLPKRAAALVTSVLRQQRIHRAANTSVVDRRV